jgi:hypothetical protein
MTVTKKAVKPATKKQVNETAVINEVSKAAAKTAIKKAVVKAAAKLGPATKAPKKTVKVEVTKAPTRTAKDLARKEPKVKTLIKESKVLPDSEYVQVPPTKIQTPITQAVKQETSSNNGRISFSELMRRAHRNSNPPF